MPTEEYAGYREVVSESFRSWYGQQRDSWTGTDTNARVTEFVLGTAPAQEADRRRTVLDVGCGRGLQTVALAEALDADAVGLDLLDVWDAPAPGRGRVRHRQGDFLSFTDGPTDLLVDNGCLHHQRQEDWQRWVRHGHGLLRPGGVWAVSTFLSPHGETVAHPLDDGRLNWWVTEQALRDLFEPEGFEFRGRTEIDRDFHYEGHWLKYLALSFTRR